MCGLISGGYARQADDIYDGEIYALYVLRNYQRQGIGTQLMLALATALNRNDIYSMLVWVLEHNPCRRFYERLNGMVLGKKAAKSCNCRSDAGPSWMTDAGFQP